MQQNLLIDAINHHKMGELESADHIYSSLLQLDPQNALVLHLRGLVAQELNKQSEAIQFFESANILKPNDFDIQLQLGISYSKSGDLEQGNAYYQKAIELNPQKIEPHVNSANNLTTLNRFEEAFAIYQRCLEIDPSSANLHYNIGTMFLKAMNPDDSVSWLQEAVRLRNNYPIAWNSLGVALTEIGKISEALDTYQKAVLQDSEFVEPLFNMHAIYLDFQDSATAIKMLELALNIDPNNIFLKFFLGMMAEYYDSPIKKNGLLDILRKEKVMEPEISSWDYLKSRGQPMPTLTGTNTKTIEIAVEAAKLQGLTLEFGVYNGKSIRRIASLVNETIHGFDSFEGIPESWNDEPQGSYSAKNKLPKAQRNVILHKGWFDETLPLFVTQHSEPIRLLHIDCDLYSSTKTIFQQLSKQIVPGTVIIFDEFIGYKSWREDEFKAFMEAVVEYGWEYQFLTFSFFSKQVTLIIK